MKIVITENQYRKIILESVNKKLISKMNKLKKFFNDIVKETKTQVGLDLGFLVTWGTTIGGFVHPITEFISGKYPELTNTDIALLSTGIILTYFTSNKEMLSKVLKKIKESNLTLQFDTMLDAARRLKTAFVNFIDSLAIPVAKISNMMAYTFLIPIIPELYETAQGNNLIDINELFTRLTMFIGISGSGILIRRLLNEIVRRFKR